MNRALRQDRIEHHLVKRLQAIIRQQKADIAILNNVINAVPGRFYWKDQQGVYLGANTRFIKTMPSIQREQHGVEDTVIGKTDEALFPKAVVDRYHKQDLDVMKTEQESTLEDTVLLPDGHTLIVQSIKRPLYGDTGEIAGIVGQTLDITPLKAAEKKRADEKNAIIHDLEYIVSHMPGYIYWKNKRSEYLGCNERLARFSHLNKPSDIIGKTDEDFEWGKQQADQFRQDDQLIMETGKNLITEYELDQKREDGQPLYVRTEKMPFYDQDGKVIGVLAIAFDITDQKALERQLIEEKNKAEQANRIKTEFMRNMEHDIRTPFSGVWGMANHLWEIEQDETKKEYLHDITQCAKELLDYCNSILDFSKIESGLLVIIDKKFVLEQLVDSVVKIELPAATYKKLQLKVSYDANIPPILIGDRYRLHKILINLVSNAIKFTKKGHIELNVSLIKKTKQSALVRLIIEDTGIGIPEDKQDYIFEKFSRLSSSNKGFYKGIGLGLRVVKNFMHDIDGEVDLVSIVGKGTQFICTIPFQLPLTNDFVEQ